jgi:autotransporter translocation and assembly factor TamB
VEKATGTLQARVRATGTPRAPVVDGVASLDGGRIELRDRDEVVEAVSASVRLEQNLLTIERAQGLLEGGKVSASGTYRLRASEIEAYALRIRADRAVARSSGLYAARVSGELVLRPLLAEDGRIYPFAEGNLFVHRAEYAGSLEPQDIAPFKPQPILYEVALEAPDRILVRNEKVDAELGGEIRVRQGVDRRTVLGRLEVLRGKYQVFLEQFRVTQGTLTWNDPTTIIPQIEAEAEAVVAPYLVVVAVSGRADQPVIQSRALTLDGRVDAGLSDSQVFQLLAAGSLGLSARALGLGPRDPNAPEGANGSETLGSGVAAGTTLVKGSLERALLRQLGFVDELDIDAAQREGGNLDFTVGVRKWLTPSLTVIYRQGLSRAFEHDVAVEYRLRRAMFLRAGYLRRQDVSVSSGVAQDYNLDLKVRHEY